MLIEFTKKQRKLREELREYFNHLMTPQLKEELMKGSTEGGGGPLFKKTLKKIGKDGWIGLSWPKENGGKGGTPLDQYIFTEEIMRSGFPYPFLTTDSVGPTIAKYGSKKLINHVIPQILGGEIVIAIGYSEPDSGTDLASLKTKALKENDHWLINGQKMWTSLAEYSDYIWLAARTNLNTNNHEGLSIFLLPTKTEGISIQPIYTLGDVRTNTTFYENVRLGNDYLVGELNKGWNLITGQLNRERISLVNNAPLEKILEDVVLWSKSIKLSDGTSLIEKDWVRNNISKVTAGTEALKLLCWKQAWAMSKGELNMADASVAKVYGSEFFIEAYRLLMEIIGEESTLSKRSSSKVLEGRLEMLYRVSSILTFGGGTNEIQRDIISMAGLSMPRMKR